MAKLGRSATMFCLLLAVLVLAAPSWAQTSPPIGEQIAKAHGLDDFDKIDAIRYTLNGQLPGVYVSRAWVWQPKTGQVSFEGKDKEGNPVKATYNQSQLADAPTNVRDVIDPAFVNDKYNLIFPFQAYWDGADIKDKGSQKLPLREGTARLVVVDYSPGDVWDLYLAPDNRIQALVFHRGGPRKPSEVITTWTGYKKAGPVLISTERNGTADGRRLYLSFTDVAVMEQSGCAPCFTQGASCQPGWLGHPS